MPIRTVLPAVHTPASLTTHPHERSAPDSPSMQGKNCSHGVAGNEPGGFVASPRFRSNPSLGGWRVVAPPANMKPCISEPSGAVSLPAMGEPFTTSYGETMMPPLHVVDLIANAAM